MNKTIELKYIICIGFFIFSTITANSLLVKNKNDLYLSPFPGSTNNLPSTSIIIREGSAINISSINKDKLVIKGINNRLINGKLFLSNDGKTIIYKPHDPFYFEENIFVTILPGIKTIDGYDIPDTTFTFQIISESSWLNNNSLLKNVSSISTLDNQSSTSIPKITTKMYNESSLGKGKIFLSSYGVINQNFVSNSQINSSVLIVNNDGTIYYAKDIGSNKGAGLTDFKMQPNGLISYSKVINKLQWTGGAEVIHMVMDKSFTVVDSFQMGNGYTAETHDFHILPNGHALLMAYYLVPIDLTKIVNGSPPITYVDGAVIQELDSDKNVIFQWRTWDHINTKNIPWGLVPNNTQQILNVFHLNSIQLDTDGNLLLGTPGMGMKISRQTGEIIWVIGGILNQFSFTNISQSEALGDFGGHTFQRIKNGNILVFDNSPFPWQDGYGSISSKVNEYEINETNKTATLKWRYIPDKIIPGWHAGSVQRLENGNTVICWGGPPNDISGSIPMMTEINSNGEKLFELYFEGSEFESYRAFRFELDDGNPNIEVTKDQIMELNTYDFKSSETNNTGIALRINSLESLGYNMITIKDYHFSPANPLFNNRILITNPRRIVISGFGINKIDSQIRFDITNWEIHEPASTTIFYRREEGKGVFTPLETTYNFVTGKLTATITGFGEYIICKQDLSSKTLAPIINTPANRANINYKLPVSLTWTPVGIASIYSLQISTDSNFTNLLVDNSLLKTAFFNLTNIILGTTYYWRVKTFNDAGESSWSSTFNFTAIAPLIEIKKPKGGERWNIGLEYFIEWSKNILEPVYIDLIYNGNKLKTITTSSNSFYLWDVDLNLSLSNNYKIKITSSTDSTLFDTSDQTFSIVNGDTIVDKPLPVNFSLEQNYPNPFNNQTIILFNLTESAFTSLKIYDSKGEEIDTIVTNFLEKGSYSFIWKTKNLPSGPYFYRLISGDLIQTKKLTILK